MTREAFVMTSCETVVPLLKSLLDGELAKHVEPVVRDHLGSCSACRGALADFEAISRTLRGMAAEARVPSRAEVARWVARAREESRITVRSLRWVAAAAAAVLVGTSALIWSLGWQSSETSASALTAVQRDNALEIVLSEPVWEEDY